jgi:hypothetical protein
MVVIHFFSFPVQFSNLRSVARFEEVRQLAERCLGDNYAKTREIAIDFFAAAFKELRQHKSVLMDLVKLSSTFFKDTGGT